MEAATEIDTRAAVPATVRAARSAEIVATADQLRMAAQWAAMHSVDSLDDAAAAHVFGETVIPIAGPGAPLVGEFCVAELAAALGMPTDHGRWLIGEAVELEHRLPRLWARVMRHDLPAWRARRIARRTMDLTPEAASFVDAQIAHVAHKIGSGVVDRLIDEAIARFMPQTAEERRAEAADGRCFTIDHRNVSFAGTSKVYGELDLADALDLDAAVTARAAHLKTLDLTTDAPERSEAATRRRPRRETVLHVHLSAAALTDPTSGAGVVGRLDSPGATDTLVTTEQIRRWCANPFARVVVKPVIDLDDHLHVASYEVPDRLAAQVTLRDRWCVFPWCTRPARVCDCDHAVPHAEGGSTCDCNLAPLYRRHHRLKTHATGWSYTVLDPGTYLWRSPHGYRFLRDHTGTRDVTDEPPPRPG